MSDLNPKRKNPLIPMGAITGKPDRARMEQVLRDYKSVGIEQFLIYPRSGLEYDYMSPDWMNLCRNTVEIAAELGMDIWLYDEYNWPSGNCRGQVTKGHEEFYPHALVFERTESGIESRVIRNKIGADILNPDAVARFLALTHQRYYDELHPYFGNVIKGIFTDEPSFGYFTRNNDGTFSGSFGEDTFLLAWYDDLEEDYHAVRGSDLRTDVEAHMANHTPAHLWEDYYRLMGNRMRTVYVGGMNNWCVAHGILLTGHLMWEDAPKSVRFNGETLKMLSEFSLPGMDEIPTRVTLDGDGHGMELSAMSLVQYAGQNKPGQLAELFALGPTDMTMSTMRQMIWITACFGVDHYVLAVAALDPKGNVEKGVYYFPTSKTQPWFEYYSVLSESAKQAAETARKTYQPAVRLRYPATLFMRTIHTDQENQIGDLYRDLLVALVRHQIQYLYLDEGEKTDLLVIAQDEGGLFLEGEEKRFNNADELAKYVNGKVSRRCVVYDEDGRETRDVLTRVWADDMVTLVDLTKDKPMDRLLTVKMGGRSGRVRLCGQDVFCGTMDDMTGLKPHRLEDVKMGALSLALEQDNLLRCLYTRADPVVRLHIAERLENLRLIVRKDPDPVMLKLDGKTVVAQKPDIRLPDGFTQLFGVTEPFFLEKGEHTLEILNGAVDYRFLPGVFLSGDFLKREDGLYSFDSTVRLGEVPGIPDYIGSFWLSAEVEIPARQGLILSLDTKGACTQAYLDGESLGTRCWVPFEWEIPDRF
ncbi:MAG TPA: hypothetical protein PLV03_04095, partial [Clostridiales bacterium]|nr:hypothetical protein [Clostridiales bacterium]